MLPRHRLGHHAAITLTSPIDGRIMFVLPWGEFSYIGTTDTDTTEEPDEVRPGTEDITYLLRSANAYFPNAHLSDRDVLASWAGLRTLLAPSKAMAASAVSREHVIVQGPGGMLSIVGGKLTTYRVMGAQMVDRVVNELHDREGRPRLPRPATDREPLPGGEGRDLATFRQVGLDLGLPEATVDHLLSQYGTEAAAVYNLGREDRGLLAPLVPDYPAIQAEVIHVTRRELACRVEDVMVRRLHLYYETSDQGAEAADLVARLMGRELRWDDARARAEARAYRETIAG
jgi:glycerol-3-phosphate dehydrogenase